MKEVSAEWFVEAIDYLEQNPSFLVNGFMKSGITEGIDGVNSDEYIDQESDNEYYNSSDDLDSDSD